MQNYTEESDTKLYRGLYWSLYGMMLYIIQADAGVHRLLLFVYGEPKLKQSYTEEYTALLKFLLVINEFYAGS
jgi:hypothetical protein